MILKKWERSFKSVNGSKINQIGLLGIKIVEGFVILLIVCDNEQYKIELGEYEDNKVNIMEDFL